jgi:TPP-dependent pyruvate/acetoin dehydrogenase alpha subunit
VSDIFNAVPDGMTAFAEASDAAGNTISAAASADSAAMVQSAAAALGPIGATYLAAYGPAQANNLAGTLLVAAVHQGLGAATQGSRSAVTTNDGA